MANAIEARQRKVALEQMFYVVLLIYTEREL